MPNTNTPKINPKTVVVNMEDYDCACSVITSFEALQALRQMVQYEIDTDTVGLTFDQIYSQLQVIELAMRHAIERM